MGLEWWHFLAMKKFLIILVIVLAAGGYYVYQDEALKSKVLGKTYQVVPELNKTTLYKWKDKSGNWQVTDRPPANNIPFTTVSTEDQVNVMPSGKED